jgi:hypothetical protein
MHTALAKVDRARLAIVQAKTVTELREIDAQLSAVAHLARRMRAALTDQNRIGALRVECAARAGAMLAAAVRPGRPRMVAARDHSLPEGVTKSQAFRWRQVADVPADVRAAYAEWCDGADQVVTFEGLHRFAGGPPPDDERYTPPEIVERVRRVFGGLADLDPACHGRHNRERIAHRCFHRDDDGLGKRWRGRVYLNPPFSAIARWMDHLVEEVAAGRVTEAVVAGPLVPDRCRWDALRPPVICLPTKRIEWLTAAGDAKANAIPSCVVYLGGRAAAFASAFKDVGLFYRLG